jgi:hypothetical protein
VGQAGMEQVEGGDYCGRSHDGPGARCSLSWENDVLTIIFYSHLTPSWDFASQGTTSQLVALSHYLIASLMSWPYPQDWMLQHADMDVQNMRQATLLQRR